MHYTKIMKRLTLAFTSILVALALPGCLQSETTIHVNKDGSGTLVEQTTLGAQMMAMLGQMAAFGGEDAKAKDPFAEMFSEDKAKARAAKIGEGVTFEKSEPITVGANKGARVTYKFKDITKLKVSPGDSMNEMSPAEGGEHEAAKKDKPVTFALSGGVLTVSMPERDKKNEGADAAAKPEENPQMEMMMKQMLGDMKMSLKVVVDSGIAETDATNRDGNTITLVDLEMGKVLENPEAFKKLNSVGQDDPQAAMEVLKGMNGVKMEVKPKITVKLK